jgi:hypothetical protein
MIYEKKRAGKKAVCRYENRGGSPALSVNPG